LFFIGKIRRHQPQNARTAGIVSIYPRRRYPSYGNNGFSGSGMKDAVAVKSRSSRRAETGFIFSGC
jgi:hypothetical protein